MENNEKLEIFKKPNGQRSVRALKAFEPGERVLFEKPTFWFGARDDPNGLGLAWGLTGQIALTLHKPLEELLETGYQPLHNPELNKRDRRILKLIAAKTKLAESRVKAIYNIVVTYNLNTSFLGFLDGQVLYGERAVICETLSFINHSCLPNTYRPECKSHEEFTRQIEEALVAIRKIEAGEEITWSYGGELPTELQKRQQLLHTNFGFWCSCERCQTESDKG